MGPPHDLNSAEIKPETAMFHNLMYKQYQNWNRNQQVEFFSLYLQHSSDFVQSPYLIYLHFLTEF